MMQLAESAVCPILFFVCHGGQRQQHFQQHVTYANLELSAGSYSATIDVLFHFDWMRK